MEFSEINSKRTKRCLSQIISKEESILEFVTATLSVHGFGCGNQKFVSFKKNGILCLVVNRVKSCLFLQLFDVYEFKKLYDIELYTNICDGYKAESKLFHVIEFPDFFLGLSFAQNDKNQPEENKEEGGALMQKTIIGTSKFLDINYNHYLYNFNFDADSEKKQLDTINETIRIEQEQKTKNSKVSKENDQKKKEIEEKLRKIEENKEIFENIEVVDSSDKKIYKLIEFHILKVKMKLVKKVYENNFNKYIGTKNIFLLNIKSHKANTHFFDNDDDDVVEEIGRGKFVEFNPNDFIEILIKEDTEDKLRHTITDLKNHSKQQDDNKDILKVTPLGKKNNPKVNHKNKKE